MRVSFISSSMWSLVAPCRFAQPNRPLFFLFSVRAHISAHRLFPFLINVQALSRIGSFTLAQLFKPPRSHFLLSISTVRDPVSLGSSRRGGGNLYSNRKRKFLNNQFTSFGNQFIFTMKLLNFVCCLVVLVAIGADAGTEFICEFSSKTLACPNGKSLDIKFANFGRIGHNVCSRGYRSGADRINNCYDESHTDLVGMLCNGQTTCLLPASNEVFGDTCPGVLKYLQVKYHCV